MIRDLDATEVLKKEQHKCEIKICKTKILSVSREHASYSKLKTSGTLLEQHTNIKHKC